MTLFREKVDKKMFQQNTENVTVFGKINSKQHKNDDIIEFLLNKNIMFD
jgi:hypothetical protein